MNDYWLLFVAVFPFEVNDLEALFIMFDLGQSHVLLCYQAAFGVCYS